MSPRIVTLITSDDVALHLEAASIGGFDFPAEPFVGPRIAPARDEPRGGKRRAASARARRDRFPGRGPRRTDLTDVAYGLH